MFSTFKDAWKNTELRRQILVTFLFVVLFRIGVAIPVPFVDTDAMLAYFSMFSNTAFGLLDTLSGGAFSNATFFALGVQPYINASIIIQLLCVAIPALEKLAKEDGELGKKRIEKITTITAVAIGIIQSYGYYAIMAGNGILKADAVGVWWKILIIIAAFSLGSVCIMLMGKAIDKNGIGNGISILLLAGIISRLPTSIMATIMNVRSGSLAWWVATLVYLGVFAMIFMIVFVYYAERRVSVIYGAKVVGRKSYSAQNTFIPMKINMGGVMPIIFAQTIATLPAMIATFIGKTSSWWARTDTIAYIIVYTVLIIAFAFFYASISFDCREITNNLRQNGGTIPGYRPGKPTYDVLNSLLAKVTFIGAIYLGIVAALPLLLAHFFPQISLTGLSLGGTTVLIAVAVVMDTNRMLETKLQTRRTTGLFETKTT